MRRSRYIELTVGIFMLLGITAALLLIFKVSGLNSRLSQRAYHVQAIFDNVGDLKVRAPVTMAGVRIGDVSQIYLDPNTLQATVTFNINADQDKIPAEATASILTQGILGSNYIGLASVYRGDENDKNNYLHEGSVITETNSALILENLIGQFIYQMQNKGEKV